jgi:membrane protein YdbS with pleckstrin-like domain
MQYPDTTSGTKNILYQSVQESIFKISTFLLHSAFFTGATLIGIARYALGVPTGLIELMTIWSAVLVLHGVVTWQRESSSVSADTRKSRDGILKTAYFASIVNAIMWVMWTLATDTRNAQPLHLTIFIVLVAATASVLIIGKRVLYAHWLKEFLRDHPGYFEETKAKRVENIHEDLQLDDDGELAADMEDINYLRLKKR